MILDHDLMIFPSGKLVRNQTQVRSLLYDEFIVYKEEQNQLPIHNFA